MIPMENFTAKERAVLAERAKKLPEIIRSTFQTVSGFSAPAIPAGGGYNGIWQEHNQDVYFLAEKYPQEAWASMDVFMEFQMKNGLMPCCVRFTPTEISFAQLQIVWPFARCAFEIIKRTGRSDDDVAKVYDAAARFDNWLARYRDHSGTGLVEMFCEYDTGHDNSRRVTSGGIDRHCPHLYAGNMPEELPCMPLIAADLSATRYQSLVALAEMAERLGRDDEAAEWRNKADAVKAKIFELLYDPADEYFYDRSPFGLRKYRTEHITRLFLNRVVDQEIFDRIYHRYFENEKEFMTPWPFPAVSVSDPSWEKEPRINCWGRNTQALTQLRSVLWMDHYGRGHDLEVLMARMLRNYLEFPDNHYTQEIDPFTGKPLNTASEYYMPAMLFFLLACRRLDIIG